MKILYENLFSGKTYFYTIASRETGIEQQLRLKWIGVGLQDDGAILKAIVLTPGKCSTVTSLISICVSVLQFAATVVHSTKCTSSSQFAFQSSILRCSKWPMRNERPPHLSRNLNLNFQIIHPKRKLRS